MVAANNRPTRLSAHRVPVFVVRLAIFLSVLAVSCRCHADRRPADTDLGRSEQDGRDADFIESAGGSVSVSQRPLGFPSHLRLTSDVTAHGELIENFVPFSKVMADQDSTAELFSNDHSSSDFSEADISKPGPDLGDYPNSAFTLPQGRIYFESATFSYQTGNEYGPAMYTSPFLLRYGLTDDVELRLMGNGLTSVNEPENSIVGFSPLILDTKIHLWDEQMDRMIPAASLEVYIQTNLGSKSLLSGVQPSLNLNLDFPLTEKTNVQMTFGYTGVQQVETVNQFSYQWAMGYQLTSLLQVFIQGYYYAPIGSEVGASKAMGGGYFYQLSTRTMLFNSYNAAIDGTSAPFSTQLGFAYAF